VPANYVSRAEVAATIIEERSGEIVTEAIEQSVALSAFRRVSVGSETLRYTIVNKLPTAQWLTANAPDPAGDLDPKPTTDLGFDKVDVTVEELATIVVIPDNVAADSSIDLYSYIRSRCVEAIGRLVDQTVFFGTAPVGGVPATFPVGGLVGQAIAKGNGVEGPAAGASFSADFIAAYSNVLGQVELDGYNAAQGFSGTQLNALFRNLTNSQGDPMLMSSFAQGTSPNPFGVPITQVTNGAWDPTKATVLIGDPNLAWLIMREDLSVKMFDSGVVDDINLITQDATAMRLKMRLGFHVTTPIGIATPNGGYPFAVMTPNDGLP
jgi:HK97 family phage major capsid protein